MRDSYYDWHAYGSDGSGSIENKLRNAEHYLTNKLGQVRDQIDDLKSTMINTQLSSSSQDLDLIEKGMYVQMLMLVGREKDAKDAAKEWISKYELSNKLREPTKEEKKAMDEELEELKKALEIAKNTKPFN